MSIGVFEVAFGPRPATALTVTDFMDPKLQRRFDNVQQIADQIQDVRVWGGIPAASRALPPKRPSRA